MKDLSYGMIPKKPAPDSIRDGNRFSDKIMRQQEKRRDVIDVWPH